MAGTHNPKVVGSNPTPATRNRPELMVLGDFLYFFEGFIFKYAPICPNKVSKMVSLFCKLCIVRHIKELLEAKTGRATLGDWLDWQVLVETALLSQHHVRQQ